MISMYKDYGTVDRIKEQRDILTSAFAGYVYEKRNALVMRHQVEFMSYCIRELKTRKG